MKNKVTREKIEKYLKLTKTALKKAEQSGCRKDLKPFRKDFIKMVQAYVSDSEHFLKNQDLVNSFAAINYAHGWLDAGARLEIFKVKDSTLFAVDD